MEKRKNISVETIPNGYALTVDGRMYMAFDVEQLLAAVFSHVGCGIEKFLNQELSKNLLEVAATWPTMAEQVRANAVLKTQVKDAQREARVTIKQLNNAADRYDALQEQFDEMKKRLVLALMKADKYDKERERADANYELYGKECRKVIRLQREVEMLTNAAKSKNSHPTKRNTAEKPQKKPATVKKASKVDNTAGAKKQGRTSRKKADALILKEIERQEKEKEQIISKRIIWK